MKALQWRREWSVNFFQNAFQALVGLPVVKLVDAAHENDTQDEENDSETGEGSIRFLPR